MRCDTNDAIGMHGRTDMTMVMAEDRVIGPAVVPNAVVDGQ